MGALAGHEADYVTRLRRNQRPLAVLGLVLALLGATYSTWGVVRFDPHGDPRVNPGFDRPVSQLAFLFQRGQVILENSVPQTPSEAHMQRALARNMQFSAGVIVMLMRILLGTLALVTGMVTMTVVVERARLLRLIQRLEE